MTMMGRRMKKEKKIMMKEKMGQKNKTKKIRNKKERMMKMEGEEK